MNRAVLHCNLPDIIQQPSLAFRQSRKNGVMPGQSLPPTGDMTPDVQQQVVPLILEAHRENRQTERSERQDASKMGAETMSSTAAAALRDCHGNYASITLEDFKENSQPPESYGPVINASFDFNGQTGFVQIMPVSCRTLAPTNLQAINPLTFAPNTSESSTSSDGFRIDSAPVYQLLPMKPVEPVIVLPTVTTSSNPAAVIVHSVSPPLHAQVLPPTASPLRAPVLPLTVSPPVPAPVLPPKVSPPLLAPVLPPTASPLCAPVIPPTASPPLLAPVLPSTASPLRAPVFLPKVSLPVRAPVLPPKASPPLPVLLPKVSPPVRAHVLPSSISPVGDAGDAESRCAENISTSENPRTVEDLMISSVVSLHSENTSEDSSSKGQVNASETYPTPPMETSTWHHISGVTPTEVRSSCPPQLLEVPEYSLTTTQNETSTLPSVPDNVQPETTNSDLIDEVLDLACMVNICKPVSNAESGTFDERTSPSNNQPGWQGDRRKISFAEAKEILKLQERDQPSNCFLCSICGELFEHAAHFTRHTLTHCKSELYCCSFCEAKSYSVLSMLHHVTSTHNLTLVEQRVSARSSPPASQHSAEAVNQSVQDDSQISSCLSESAPHPLQYEADQQQEARAHPRPLQDYVYKPSILETYPNFDVMRDVYQCLLCQLKIKDRNEFIYHLRMFHEQTPYRCCHCHQSFSFILDFEVHFSENHSSGMPTRQLQSNTCDQQTDAAPDGQFVGNQAGYASSCQPFGVLDFGTPIGQGDLDSTSLKNSYDLNNEPQLSVDTTTEQHGGSVSPGSGIPSTDLESQLVKSNKEMSPQAVKVKQEFTEPQNSSCMMNNAAVSQDCVRVKVEQLEVSEDGSDLGVRAPSTYEGSREEESPSVVRVKQERITDDEADIPCPEPIIAESFGSGITVKMEKLDEDADHCINWNDNAESMCVPFPVQLFKSTTAISGEHEQQTAQSLDFEQSALVSGLSNSSGETPSCLIVSTGSTNVEEAQIGPGRGGEEVPDWMGSIQDVKSLQIESDSSVCLEVNRDSSNEVTVTGRIGVEDSSSNHDDISDRPFVGGTGIESTGWKSPLAPSESVTISSPAGEETAAFIQSMDDDLIKLASEAGITITGDATAPLEEACHRSEQPVLDTTVDGVKDDELHERNGLSDSDDVLRPSHDKETIFVKQEKVWQEESSTINNLNADMEANTCIGEDLAQTSASSQRKRSPDDSLLVQGTEKRQRLEPPSVGVDVIAPGLLAPEEALPSLADLGAIDSTDVTNQEVSAGRVSLQTGEEQRGGPSPLGTCEDMSTILNDVSKNFFTSRILQSMEREQKESMLQRNSLDLDLFGPSFGRVSGSEVPGQTEKVDIPRSEKRRVDFQVGFGPSKHKNWACAGNMPQIYDVTGNGEMPDLPCRLANEDWNNIPPIINPQDELISPDAGSRDHNHTRNGARQCRPLKSPHNPVRSADGQVMTRGHCPRVAHHVPEAAPEANRSDENWRLKGLVKDTWPALARIPDATVSKEAASSSGYLEGRKGSGHPSRRTHNNYVSQDDRHQQQGRPHLPGAAPYTCEEALPRCHQEPELVSPTLGRDQWICSRRGFQDFPDTSMNSRRPPQAHGSQEYQQTSLQTVMQPPTGEKIPPGTLQQDYRHSGPTQHEAGQRQSHVTRNQSATLNPQMHFHYFGGHSSGKSWILDDWQPMASTGKTNQILATNSKPDTSYSRGNTRIPSSHSNNYLTDHQNDTEQRNRPSSKQRSFRGNQQNRKQSGGVLQSLLSGNAGSLSGLPHMNFRRQQSLPSRVDDPTAPSSLIRQRRVSQPTSSSKQQEPPGSRQMRETDCSPPYQRGLPAPSGWSNFSQSRCEGSPCLPQIASVTSLHPRYIQRTGMRL